MESKENRNQELLHQIKLTLTFLVGQYDKEQKEGKNFTSTFYAVQALGQIRCLDDSYLKDAKKIIQQILGSYLEKGELPWLEH